MVFPLSRSQLYQNGADDSLPLLQKDSRIADQRPTLGQDPYFDQFNTLWAVAHNDDGTSKLTLSTIAVPAGPVNMNAQNLQNLAAPVLATDAVTKAYADALAVGLNVKAPVVVGTTASIALSSTQTIDGVAVTAGQRVLVKNQNDPTANGIYVAASGAWAYALDADTSPEVTSGMFTLVTQGTAQAGEGWILTTPNPITLGTSSLSFSQFSSASSGIPPSTVTTKGDMLAATGSAAVVRVPGGTNNQILTYDTTQAANVKWAAPAVPALDTLGVPTDNTSLNASTAAHGLAPKGDGVTGHFLNSALGWSTPTGTGGVAVDPIWNTKGDLAVATGPDTAAIVGLGTNGQVLSVNTATSTGLSWTAPATGSSSPWSTTLASGVTSGANTITVADALPAAKLIAGGVGQYAYFVIDAWTTNAEFYLAAVDGTGKGLGFASGMAHNHSAGASVLLVEDLGINAAWWGTIGNGGNATSNSTALNALFTQLSSGSNNPLGVGFAVTGVGCSIAAQVTAHGRGVGSLSGFGLTATSDFGANTAVFDCSSVSGNISNCTVSCAVSPPAFNTFVAGGSTPWVLMDGFRVSSRQVIENCGATNVRAGFYMVFFDHASMKDTLVKACFYGYYFQGSTNAGDANWTRCYSDGTYRSAWGFGPGCNQSQGSAYYNCSWVNTPFIRYFEGDGRGAANGCVPIQLIHDTCNIEFLGNCYYYAEPGSGRTTIWEVWLGNNNTLSGASASGYSDSNYPATAAIINNSGTTMFIQNAEWTIGPGGYVFDSPSGNIAFTGASKFTTNAQGAPTAICKTGCSPSLNPRLISGPASGPAAAAFTGPGVVCDLTEVSGSNWQQYQTAGAAPTGVIGMTPTGGVAAILDQGEALINSGTNVIAAGKYVKPDMSGFAYRTAVLALSPVGLWDLSEAAFAVPALDQVGNSNGGYQNTSGLTFGQTGISGGGGLTSVKFTAANNGYVGIPDVAAQHVGDTFTVEAWIKIASLPAVAACIFSGAASAPALFIDSTGALDAQKDHQSVIVQSTSNLTVDGLYHHVVWTKATTTNKLYIDGTDVTGSVTNATISNSSGYNIGRDQGSAAFGTPYPFDGTIQFVALYPTALSGATVAANHTLGAATLGSTAGHVIQASSYSDGPIVGKTLAASSSNRVLVKL